MFVRNWSIHLFHYVLYRELHSSRGGPDSDIIFTDPWFKLLIVWRYQNIVKIDPSRGSILPSGFCRLGFFIEGLECKLWTLTRVLFWCTKLFKSPKTPKLVFITDLSPHSNSSFNVTKSLIFLPQSLHRKFSTCQDGYDSKMIHLEHCSITEHPST